MGVTIRSFHDRVGQLLVLFRQLCELTSNQALGREDRIPGVGYRLTLGGLANQPFPTLRKSHHRGSRARSFRVLQDDRFTGLHHRHAGVRSP